MFEKIIKDSYYLVKGNTKLIKLGLLTNFLHSFVINAYFIYQFYVIINNKDIFFIIEEIKNIDYSLIISLLIIGIISYFILPGFFQASIINYLNEKNFIGSILKGFIKLPIMIQINGILSVFSFLIFIIIILRAYTLEMLFHPIIISIFILWFILIIIVNFLTSYVRFIIILENKKINEAIDESINIALKNYKITLKGLFFSYFLLIRYIINLLLIFFIPAIIIKYIYDQSGIEGIKYLFYIFAIIGFLITSYINSVFEVFLIIYWKKIYDYIKSGSLTKTG